MQGCVNWKVAMNGRSLAFSPLATTLVVHFSAFAMQEKFYRNLRSLYCALNPDEQKPFDVVW